MSTASIALPPGFEELQPFVPEWDFQSFDERHLARGGKSLISIRSFYEAMVPRTGDALALAEKYPLHEMPEDVARLFRLVLALAHAAMAIEIHGASVAPFSPYPDGLKLTRSFQLFG